MNDKLAVSLCQNWRGKVIEKKTNKKRCWEDTERKLWKLIRENEVEYKGELFRWETWVYPCGGTVEYIEDIDEKDNRIYQVQCFELSPKSWVIEKPITTKGGSLIFTEKFKDKEKALALAKRWRSEVISCEVCETERWTVFRFKTGVKPLRVNKRVLDDFQRFD